MVAAAQKLSLHSQALERLALALPPSSSSSSHASASPSHATSSPASFSLFMLLLRRSSDTPDRVHPLFRRRKYWSSCFRSHFIVNRFVHVLLQRTFGTPSARKNVCALLASPRFPRFFLLFRRRHRCREANGASPLRILVQGSRRHALVTPQIVEPQEVNASSSSDVVAMLSLFPDDAALSPKKSSKALSFLERVFPTFCLILQNPDAVASPRARPCAVLSSCRGRNPIQPTFHRAGRQLFARPSHGCGEDPRGLQQLSSLWEGI